MSKPIVRRLIVVLALSALLGSPATSLPGPRSAVRHSRAQAAQAPLSWLWNVLASGWEKEGSAGDPYGQPVKKLPRPSQRAGHLIAMDGRYLGN
jgi:hypothetical protein